MRQTSKGCRIAKGNLMEDFLIDTILKYTPPHPVAAALILLLLYALKSVSVFFPILVLEVAVGHLFPTGTALFLNFAGVLICHTIPYWIGYSSGNTVLEKLKKRYPKFATVLDAQLNNSFFSAFLFRSIHILPGDVISLYFGAAHTPYFHYIIGGMFGTLPGVVLATLLGTSISDPTSPLFLVSVISMVVLTGISFLINYLYKRKVQKGDN